MTTSEKRNSTIKKVGIGLLLTAAFEMGAITGLAKIGADNQSHNPENEGISYPALMGRTVAAISGESYSCTVDVLVSWNDKAKPKVISEIFSSEVIDPACECTGRIYKAAGVGMPDSFGICEFNDPS